MGKKKKNGINWRRRDSVIVFTTRARKPYRQCPHAPSVRLYRPRESLFRFFFSGRLFSARKLYKSITYTLRKICAFFRKNRYVYMTVGHLNWILRCGRWVRYCRWRNLTSRDENITVGRGVGVVFKIRPYHRVGCSLPVRRVQSQR